MPAREPTTAVSFQAQQEFYEIPLGIGVEEEVLDEQMREFSRDHWGDREEWEPLRRMFAGMHTANAQQLASGGAIYQAMGVFPLGGTTNGSQPPERISRCTLLVSVRELDNPDPTVSVAGITEALSRTNDGGETQLVSLPAGPAVLNIAGSRAVWDLAEGEQERFLIRIELWLPFPTENRLLLFCLSTSDVEDLFMYQAVLADIADTIAFGDTGHAETDVDAEAGLKSDFG
ncbi:hypothetical protein [Streptomyces flavidovirens]|uniref:Uncharacterized protein n=1 Tax=Streptomyces flavidovirens TaxID=67298 RepID=A0ABW6RQV6_9ACTN